MPTEPDIAAAADKMLAAFDFSRQSADSKREMEGVLKAFIQVLDAVQDLEQHCQELVAAGHSHVPSRSISVTVKLGLRELASVGVEPLQASGKHLDLNQHEVVEVRPVAEMEPDLVLEERVRGYTWKGQLLRRSRVVISGPVDGAQAATTTL